VPCALRPHFSSVGLPDIPDIVGAPLCCAATNQMPRCAAPCLQLLGFAMSGNERHNQQN
jgi:hypothetical protein